MAMAGMSLHSVPTPHQGDVDPALGVFLVGPKQRKPLWLWGGGTTTTCEQFFPLSHCQGMMNGQGSELPRLPRAALLELTHNEPGQTRHNPAPLIGK